MSDQLKKLVEQWHEEVANHHIIYMRWYASVGILKELNELIYQKCQEESIDIASLNLSEKKERSGNDRSF